MNNISVVAYIKCKIFHRWHLTLWTSQCHALQCASKYTMCR